LPIISRLGWHRAGSQWFWRQNHLPRDAWTGLERWTFSRFAKELYEGICGRLASDIWSIIPGYGVGKCICSRKNKPFIQRLP